MADVYKLTFVTDTNNQVTMNINHPNGSCSDSQVKEVMNKIVESDALIFSDGKLKTPEKAELVTIIESEINL